MIKDNETNADAWIFNCPIHGWEVEVFCFRANDEALISRWFMLKMMIIEPSLEQRISFFNLYKQQVEAK